MKPEGGLGRVLWVAHGLGLAGLLLAGCAAPASRSPGVKEQSLGGLLSSAALSDLSARACFGAGERPEEFEPYAAINPADPRHVVAVWMLGDDRARWVVQSVVSRDGGQTWSPPRTPAVSRCAGGARDWITSFHDEWLAVGPDGRAYLSSLVAHWKEEPRHNGVQVVVSPDGGDSWGEPVIVAESTDPDQAFDNTAVVADPVRPGVAFVATTEYKAGVLPPGAEAAKLPRESRAAGFFSFARTTDGGRTWTPLRSIGATPAGRRVSAPQFVIGALHRTLYGIYFEGDVEEKRNAQVRIVRSTDDGDTWDTPTTVVNLVTPPGGEVRLPFTEMRLETGDDIVSSAIDAKSGTLYVAFADGRFGGDSPLQVAVTRSCDRGRTWSEPVQVSSQVNALAFLPAVAVSREGLVSVAYHDLASTDDTPLQFATVPVNVRRRAIAADVPALRPGAEALLDRFNLLGSVHVNSVQTSDFLSNVSTARGFLTVYARSRCGPYSVDCAGLPGSGKSRDLMAVVGR